MNSRFVLSLSLGAWCSVHAQASARKNDSETAPGVADQTQDYKVVMRGFVTTRFNHNQHDMGGSEPLFPAPIPLRSTLRASANQTQLGFGLEAPPSNGLTNRLYVEIDFLSSAAPGDDRVFNRAPRMRQAWWWQGWNEDQ